MSSPSKDPGAELADLRERLALAQNARDGLLAQCHDLLRLIEELQGRIDALQARDAGGQRG